MTSDFLVPEADPCAKGHGASSVSVRTCAFSSSLSGPNALPPTFRQTGTTAGTTSCSTSPARTSAAPTNASPSCSPRPPNIGGIMCAPFIGPVSIEHTAPGCLGPHGIEQVICGGENYGGARPCNFDWVRALRRECVAANVTFAFIETGSIFVKDGRTYHLRGKKLQSQQAWKSGMGYQGRAIAWHPHRPLGSRDSRAGPLPTCLSRAVRAVRQPSHLQRLWLVQLLLDAVDTPLRNVMSSSTTSKMTWSMLTVSCMNRATISTFRSP